MKQGTRDPVVFQAAVELYCADWTQSRVARALHISRSTASSWYRELKALGMLDETLAVILDDEEAA